MIQRTKLGPGRDRKQDSGAFAHRTFDFKASTQHFRTLADQLQPQAAALLQGIRVKTLAIIVHTDADPIFTQVQHHFYKACLAVTGGISEQS